MTTKDAIKSIFKNNTSAIEFYSDICDTLHFWDDLVDKDTVIEDKTVHDMMDALLFRLPLNSFYRQHEVFLRPILLNSIMNWRVANEMERHPQDENDLYIAFILRSAYVDLLSIGAVLVFGQDAAIPIVLKLRRAIHSEGIFDYIENLENERSVRGVA